MASVEAPSSLPCSETSRRRYSETAEQPFFFFFLKKNVSGGVKNERERDREEVSASEVFFVKNSRKRGKKTRKKIKKSFLPFRAST